MNTLDKLDQLAWMKAASPDVSMMRRRLYDWRAAHDCGGARHAGRHQPDIPRLDLHAMIDMLDVAYGVGTRYLPAPYMARPAYVGERIAFLWRIACGEKVEPAPEAPVYFFWLGAQGASHLKPSRTRWTWYLD